MPDFSKRTVGREMMDDLVAGGPDLHQALRELDAINYGLGGNYVTLNGVCELLRYRRDALHIADLGCGSGDMLKRIRTLLERKNIDAVLTGIDANPHVIDFAIHHTPPSCAIQYRQTDIFSEEFSGYRFDIVTGTLFFHHFTSDELVKFFALLKSRVRLGIVINDLHRHWFAYYAIKWLTRMFSRSAMVRNDAPLSVLRGFSRQELRGILEKAGITRFRMKWCWAFRWQVVVPGQTFDEQ